MLWGYDKKTCPECGMEIPSSARRCPYCHGEFGNNSLFDDIHQYGCLGLPVIGLIILGCFWLIGKCSNPHIESSPTNNVGYLSSTSQKSEIPGYIQVGRVSISKYKKYKINVEKAFIYTLGKRKKKLTGGFYSKGAIVWGTAHDDGFVGVVSDANGYKNGDCYLKISDVKPLE